MVSTTCGNSVRPAWVATQLHNNRHIKTCHQVCSSFTFTFATSDVGMKALGVDHPLSGPLFQSYTHKSPASITTHEDSMCIIEAEFAFSMKYDLPPKATDYSREEVCNAIAAIHPAIEIVNTRCIDGFTAGANWTVADFTANEAFIIGEAVVDWRQFDLANHVIYVEINGAPKEKGVGAAVLGHPINVLHWLVNHLSARNITLKATDFVSTGITTPIITGLKGDSVEADFGSLGLVEVEIQ